VKLSIIVVNTNEWHVLRTCLRSVFEQTNGIDFELIVVDNASTDGTKEEVAAEFPGVKLVANPENLGFAASNNRGIRQSVGEYILLLNPDTEVLDGAIQKTVQFMEEHPNAGIAGCRLQFADGSLQRSVSSFPSVLRQFCHASFIYLLFAGSTMIRGNSLIRFDYTSDEEVDCVLGAYFMFTRKVLQTVGLLDEQFYMYSEEVDYCYRAKSAGFGVWYTPRARVVHHWGGINSTSRRGIAWLHASQMLLFQKHFRGVEKNALVLLTYVGALVRVGVYLSVGCLTLNKRYLTKSYHFAYAIYNLLSRKWIYRPGFTGEVVPWTRLT
jgi:hypothetical protein